MIIGLVGLAGSGKDTVADHLVAAHDFRKVALADPLKRICKEVFDFTDAQLWGPSANRNAPDPRWGGLTPRHALQRLGTEWGRECHPDVWIGAGLRIAREILRGTRYDARLGLVREGYAEPAGVVIPDVRFANEVAAINAAGGMVVRIVCPWAGLNGVDAAHLSEQGQAAIPSSKFAGILVNDCKPVSVLHSRIDHLMVELRKGLASNLSPR